MILSREEIEMLREDLLNIEGWLPDGQERMRALCDMALAFLAVPEELPTAWIVTGPSGYVYHFAAADGWKVDVAASQLPQKD